MMKGKSVFITTLLLTSVIALLMNGCNSQCEKNINYSKKLLAISDYTNQIDKLDSYLGCMSLNDNSAEFTSDTELIEYIVKLKTNGEKLFRNAIFLEREKYFNNLRNSSVSISLDSLNMVISDKVDNYMDVGINTNKKVNEGLEFLISTNKLLGRFSLGSVKFPEKLGIENEQIIDVILQYFEDKYYSWMIAWNGINSLKKAIKINKRRSNIDEIMDLYYSTANGNLVENAIQHINLTELFPVYGELVTIYSNYKKNAYTILLIDEGIRLFNISLTELSSRKCNSSNMNAQVVYEALKKDDINRLKNLINDLSSKIYPYRNLIFSANTIFENSFNHIHTLIDFYNTGARVVSNIQEQKGMLLLQGSFQQFSTIISSEKNNMVMHEIFNNIYSINEDYNKSTFELLAIEVLDLIDDSKMFNFNQREFRGSITIYDEEINNRKAKFLYDRSELSGWILHPSFNKIEAIYRKIRGHSFDYMRPE